MANQAQPTVVFWDKSNNPNSTVLNGERACQSVCFNHPLNLVRVDIRVQAEEEYSIGRLTLDPTRFGVMSMYPI